MAATPRAATRTVARGVPYTFPVTADDFRELALDLEGAVESAHMGHPDFRVNGRIFATLQANMESGAVMLAPEEQQEFLRTHPKTFTPASGAWGRQGSTMVRLAGAEPAAVRGAVLMAWQRALALPARKPASRKSATPRPATRTASARKSTVRKTAARKKR
jgi:hypothetical protein